MCVSTLQGVDVLGGADLAAAARGWLEHHPEVHAAGERSIGPRVSAWRQHICTWVSSELDAVDVWVTTGACDQMRTAACIRLQRSCQEHMSM